MKKLFAIIMSVLMITCFMPTIAFANTAPKTWDSNGKFKLELSSGETKATAEVYDDFSVSAKVVGDTVNAKSVTIGVTLKDVQSLNVEGTKKKEITITTDIDDKTSLSLPKYFPHIFGYAYPSDFITSEDNVTNFDGGVINGKIDNEAYEYNLGAFTKSNNKEGEKNVYTLKATPTDSAQTQKAWNKLAGFINSETAQDADENSEHNEIIIKSGTTIQIGTSKITFDNEGDFKIAKSGQEKVKCTGEMPELDESTEALSNNVEVYLPKETKLQVGYSSATLNRGLYIRSNIEVPKEQIKIIYDNFKTLNNTDANKEDKDSALNGLIVNLVKVIDNTIEDIDDEASRYIDIKGEYKLTVKDVNGNTTETGSYAYGDTISLSTAPAVSGKTFDCWKDANGNTVTSTTTITADMTITPTYKATSSGGSGGGGGAVIIPDTTDNVTNKTETKTESTETGTETTKVPTTTATISAETKTNADGTKTTTAAVDSTTATKIIEKAVENKSEEVIVNAGTTAVAETAAGTTTEVAIPAETVAQISEKTDAAVIIKSDAAEVTLDKEAVAAVAEQAGDEGSVKLIVETVAQEENKVQVELKLESSNGTISDFKGGNVSVTVMLNSALAAKSLICVYIDDNGVYHKVSGQKNTDGTYTFITGHFSTYAIIPEEKADEIITGQNEKAAGLIKALSFKARSVKTAKGNIKVNLTVTNDAIQAIERLGYTVKYKFYRSTKKSSSYQAKLEKTGKTYTNTTGKKGTRYYYKARVMVYDSEGTLIAKTALKQCKYATRIK